MLANQLDHKEFTQFIFQYINKHKGRNFILESIFKSVKNMEDSKKELIVTPMTNVISSIITNRDSNKQEFNNSTLDNITKLPSALIVETASYLKAPEYIVFSQCNRKIYVSCNSPCKIYHMPTCLLKVFFLSLHFLFFFTPFKIK